MDRITITELNAAFRNFVAAYERAGLHRTISAQQWGNTRGEFELNASHIAMQVGSKMYGNAFRIFYINPDGGGHYELDLNGYIGITKREAVTTLRAYTSAIYAVLNAR